MNTPRAFKVAEQIRAIVAADLLQSADPRLDLISVTSVTATADLREAYVYWTIHGGAEKIREGKAGLESVSGKLKKALAQRLQIRFVPNLTFFYDDTLDTQDEVDKLMAKVAEKEENNNES